MSTLNHAPLARLAIAAGILGVGFLSLAGCEQGATDPRAALRQQFLLASEPADPVTISTAKDQASAKSQLVLVGRVGAGDETAAAADQAMFLISEVPVDDQGHAGSDHPANCPFCKRRAAQAPKAAVQFVDADGQILPFGVHDLFEVREGDVVVVRGQANYNPDLDLLSLTADGIYVRR